MFRSICLSGPLALSLTAACEAKTKISTISPIIAAKIQTITLTGLGFGTHAPYTGNSNYIAFSDCNSSRKCTGTGTWEAGYAPDGNSVGLIIQSWTNTKIVIGGFSGDYGVPYELSDGQIVAFQIANPKTGKLTAACFTVVGGGTQNC